ncbi:DUF3419 family protein [Flavobacterium maritimum]|uniref:DUF3419 family protein n=1 Tax=Flavobacterium maritimum TaxID=3149042 RepID=UPI0032B55D3D
MIYYSHVNEDNSIERQLLQQENYPTVIAIAGSGERVLALLDNVFVKKMIIVDSNIEAIFLLQLKLAVLTKYSTDDYLKFIGHDKVQNNIRNTYFESIKNELTSSCRLYWENNKSIIEEGILNVGHFEKFLNRIRPILTFFLGEKFYLIFKNENFQSRHFPKLLWKMIAYFFSQKWIYRLFGNRDSAFISADARNKKIPEAITKIIMEGKVASNFMMHLIFKGSLKEMKEEHLPPSLQKKIINNIQNRIVNEEIEIEYWHGDLLELIKSNNKKLECPIFYSVSDILSFESFLYLEKLIEYCMEDKSNNIVFRSFLRNSLTNEELVKLSKKDWEIKLYDERESTKMYHVFSVRKL